MHKSISAFLFFICPLLLTAQQDDLLGLPRMEGDTGTVHKVVERMPLFPGCSAEDLESLPYSQLKTCADRAMLDFIYGELDYPEEALDRKVEGMAVISFMVERDGRITSVRIVSDPGNGIGEEALRIVDIMAWELPPWYPGKQQGEFVRVQYNIPIKFQLPKPKRNRW